jgi:membrane protease YdiL (CAAX protease family)
MDEAAIETSAQIGPATRPAWPVRVLRFPLVKILLATALLLVVAIDVPYLAGLALASVGSSSVSVRRIFIACLGSAAACLAYAEFVRLLEWRRPTELGLRRAGREYLAGAAIGCLLMSVVIGILFAVGVYRVDEIKPNDAIPAALFVCMLTGIFEELVARCVWLRILEEWLGTWLALLISALFFGFAHAGNTGATLWSSVAIALEAGLLLGAGFILTRRLWLVAGMHAAWNFTQGSIFGASVSGENANGLLKAQLVGPDWLTGGSFGPEASVVAVAVCTAAGLGMLVFARQYGTWVAPFWSRKRLTAPMAIEVDPSPSPAGERMDDAHFSANHVALSTDGSIADNR